MVSRIVRYLTDFEYASARLQSRLVGYKGYLRNPGRLLHKHMAKRRFAELRRTDEYRAIKQRIEALGALPGMDELGAAKYLEADRYAVLNLRRAYELGLHRAKGLNILDLGSGCGYWLWVARLLGHTGVGLDIPEPDLYRMMFEIFGLKRVVQGIEAMTPLPDFGCRFDLVTAFAICFISTPKCPQWGDEEWRFLLADVFDNQLREGGRLVLSFNAPHMHQRLFELKGYRFQKYDEYRLTVTRPGTRKP